jgi:dolichyl-diphosphooligosaccharide--protein glycosyltransferase
MTGVREATDSFLAEYPESADALQSILDRDRQGEWTFDEIPLDSGRFGELVSRGIAEQATEGYRLADRQAVAAALTGEPESQASTEVSESRHPQLALPTNVTVEPRVVGAIVSSLLVVVGLRLLAYPQVFRNGDVVLLGNDPYYYRYWLEQLLTQSTGVGDLQALSSLPGSVSKGEPLLVATLWLAAMLIGGDAGAAGSVLAWYPVLSALIVGLVVYLLGSHLFEDRRVGLAAVIMLALIPAHAFRTSIGFADHHAFDYIWLALTMAALVVLSESETFRDWRPWAAAGGLGVAIAGQTLAWDAGPLLLLPIGIYMLGRSLSELRTDRSPLRSGGPLLIGLGLGALLTHVGHQTFNWHTPVVAYAPFLLLLGCLAVFVASELASRIGLAPKYLAGTEVVGLVAGVVVFPRVLPTVATALDRGVVFLLQTEGIVETTSILSGQLGSIFGPVSLFGWILFLALPYLSWASLDTYRRHTPAVLVPVLYGWFFLLLAIVQLRFAGQLAIPIALFAGVGFVHLTSWLDIADEVAYLAGEADPPTRPAANSQPSSLPHSFVPTIPDRQTAFALGSVLLLVGSMSFIMVPVKTNQLTVTDNQYQAATWMDEYATQQGWEYPDNYVFSIWDRNRVYNYFVNGESRSYSYARSNYGAFVTATDGEAWYMRLRDRVGFIITQDPRQGDAPLPAQSLQTRLHTQYGSGSPAAPGLAHYRAVYVSPDGSLKVFTLVPGAQVVGTAPTNSDVSIATTQSINGHQFTYSRTVETTADGRYAVTVPYAGTYTVNGDQVDVSTTAIRQNETVSVS